MSAARDLEMVGAAIARGMAERVGLRTQLEASLEKRDRRAWIESRLWIRDKRRRIVPLRFNDVQEIVWAGWEARGFVGIRENILKFRQGGISTLALAAFFEEACNVPNTNVAIISRDGLEVQRKLETVKLFWERLPRVEQPRLVYNSVLRMTLHSAPGGERIGSTIFVGAAGNVSFGRGDTLHRTLASEAAFWREEEKLLTSVQGATPDEGWILVESTANGAETYHHGHYREARDGEKNGYYALFLPWYRHREYRRPDLLPLGPAESDRQLEEEDRLRGRGVDDEQIAWRRAKKRELGKDFPQEHPEDDEEAFLRSGRVRFDPDRLAAIAHDHVKDPLRVEPARGGRLAIYAEPEAAHHYTVGADTSEGLDGDYDSAHVVDDATGAEVAHLHGRWPMHVYGDLLCELGRRYGTALLAVERNDTGHAVLQRIVQGAPEQGAQPYPIGRVYHHMEFDDVLKKLAPRVGWPTNAATKPLLETALEKLIEAAPQAFLDRETVAELRSVVYRKDGSVGAPEGEGHDDRFISRAIAEATRGRSRPAMRSRAPIISGRPAGMRRDDGGYRDPRDG